MSIEELKYKEETLRNCFKKKLEHLDVDGYNDYATVKCVKTYGVLWHLVHQLLLAEERTDIMELVKSDTKEKVQRSYNTTAETMNVQATGLKMGGTK